MNGYRILLFKKAGGFNRPCKHLVALAFMMNNQRGFEQKSPQILRAFLL